MKKTRHSKLALTTQPIRILSDETLAHAVGGSQLEPIQVGFIMKDTIIVRTSGR